MSILGSQLLRFSNSVVKLLIVSIFILKMWFNTGWVKLLDPAMGGENGTHKKKSEKRARLAPNGSSDPSNPPLGALEPEAFKEENNGLTEPQEKDTTLKDFYFGDDDEDDEDDEWQPSKIPFDHENSFCINCTVRNYDCTTSSCKVSLFHKIYQDSDENNKIWLSEA